MQIAIQNQIGDEDPARYANHRQYARAAVRLVLRQLIERRITAACAWAILLPFARGIPIADQEPAGSVEATITTLGGDLTWPGVLALSFPEHAFDEGTSVSAAVVSTPSAAEALDLAAVYLEPISRLNYQLRIEADSPPGSQTIRVKIQLSSEFAANVALDSHIAMLAQIYQDGGDNNEVLDSFEELETLFDPSSLSISAEVPTGAFTDARHSGLFELVLAVATLPDAASGTSASGGLASAAATNAPPSCVAPVICPLESGCTPTRDYSPIPRPHPKTSAPRTHLGIDYRAPDLTEVRAAADGVVRAIQYNRLGGLLMNIAHTSEDGAQFATQYMHLFGTIAVVGQPVKAGDLIALSDSTGEEITGPHLHFEYVTYTPVRTKVDAKECLVECLNDENCESGLCSDDGLCVPAECSTDLDCPVSRPYAEWRCSASRCECGCAEALEELCECPLSLPLP